MSLVLTVSESLIIERTPEAVWDFTQDFAQRSAWDPSILEARVIEREPRPRVEVRGPAGFSAVLRFSSIDRTGPAWPSKTSDRSGSAAAAAPGRTSDSGRRRDGRRRTRSR